MPLISIETNQILDDESVLKDISAEVAKILEKPEGYVMLKFTHNTNMLFAGNALPLAHIKLKSLGLPEDKAADISMCHQSETISNLQIQNAICGVGIVKHFNLALADC